MDLPYEAQASDGERVRWDWTRIFLLLTASLTATVGFEYEGLEVLRVAGIQYLEFIYLFQILVLIVLFPRQRFRARLLRSVVTMGLLYAAFLLIAFVLSLWALRNDFYLPTGLSFLKHPFWITVSRMTELFLDVAIMLYLVQLFRANRSNLIFTLRTYFWVGTASAVFSMVTYPLNVYFQLNWGTYLVSHRMRGFYNEGGHYGIYVISVLLVGIVLVAERWETRGRIQLASVALCIALLGSQSKAAIFAAALIMIFNALMLRRAWARLGVIAALLLTVLAASLIPAISESLIAYYKAPEKYEYLSNVEGERDLLYGRMAGAFMVRRMIEVHPWVGIGWGNYPIVRNSPEYRGGSKFVDFVDDPGLGLLGATADFGIPLTMFLIAITFYPYFYLRRRGAPLSLKNLALLQPVVHLCGAQLNLTYPWLITAFALGLGYYHTRQELHSSAPPASPSGPVGQSLPAPFGVEAL